MALSIVLHHRLEALAQALESRLDTPLGDPFQAEVVLTPAFGLGRWLQRRLAQRNGICANTRFELPGRFLWELTARLVPGLSDRSPLDATGAQWSLLALFDTLPPDAPELALLRARLAAAAPRDRLALAREIALCFDRYLAWRRDVVATWESGRLLNLSEDEAWQSTLWRLLLNRLGVGSAHPFDRVREVLAQAHREGPEACAELRRRLGVERVTLIGLQSLSPDQWSLYGALSEVLDVAFLVTDPCREFWEDLQGRRTLVTQLRTRALAGADARDLAGLMNALHALDESAPRLLSSWGRAHRDVLVQLGDLAERAGIQIDDRFRDDAPEDLPDRVLPRLQESVRSASREVWSDWSDPGPEVDDSLHVHVCHSLLRQAEVLHDELLRAFRELPGLRPDDIVVLCADLDEAAPAVRAVFDAVPRERRIPWQLSGLSAIEHPVVLALPRLLRLARGPWSRDEVLELLDNPAVAEALALDPEDLSSLSQALLAAGVHEGDAPGAALDTMALPDRHGWRAGIERLLMGRALGDTEAGGFAGVAAVRAGSALSADLLGRLLVFFDVLGPVQQLASGPQGVAVWCDHASELLETLFAQTLEHREGLRLVRDALESLRRASTPEPDLRLDLDSFVQALTVELQSPARAAQAAGTVSFVPLGALRGLPFRVVAVLGLEEGRFPRRQRAPEYDLLQIQPRLGDRSAGLDDRGSFLDALMSAGERLRLFYTGRGLRDDAALNPSPVLSELLEELGAAADARVHHHRLQVFSPRTFTEGPGSHAREWAPVASALRRPVAQRSGAEPLSEASPAPPPPPTAIEPLSLDEVLAALQAPARAWLEAGLQIRIPGGQGRLEPEAPLEAPTEGAELPLLEDLTRALLAGQGPEILRARLASRPEMPGDAAGRWLGEGCLERALQIAQAVRREGGDRVIPVGRSLRLSDGRTLSAMVGEVSGPGGSCQLLWSAWPLGARAVLQAWLQHLFVQSLPGAGASQTVLLAANARVVFGAEAGAGAESPSPQEARAALEEAVAHALAARQGLQPWSPRALWRGYWHQGKHQTTLHEGRVRTAWQGGSWGAPAECDEAWTQAAWRGATPDADTILHESLPVYRAAFESVRVENFQVEPGQDGEGEGE